MRHRTDSIAKKDGSADCTDYTEHGICVIGEICGLKALAGGIARNSNIAGESKVSEKSADLEVMARENNHKTRGASRLILASASPQRAALMREYGYEFEVMTPPLTEPEHLTETALPGQQAEALSYFKARSTAELVDHGIILAADTIVVLTCRLFGKPVDRDDARRILRALAGTTHHVITGVTLLNAATGDRLIQHDSTAVTMKLLTGEELEGYLDTGAWAGKAGAYGIQDRGDAFIERIDGSFTNVVGLPMKLVSEMFRKWRLPEKSAPTKPPSSSCAATSSD